VFPYFLRKKSKKKINEKKKQLGEIVVKMIPDVTVEKIDI